MEMQKTREGSFGEQRVAAVGFPTLDSSVLRLKKFHGDSSSPFCQYIPLLFLSETQFLPLC